MSTSLTDSLSYCSATRWAESQSCACTYLSGRHHHCAYIHTCQVHPSLCMYIPARYTHHCACTYLPGTPIIVHVHTCQVHPSLCMYIPARYTHHCSCTYLSGTHHHCSCTYLPSTHHHCAGTYLPSTHRHCACIYLPSTHHHCAGTYLSGTHHQLDSTIPVRYHVNVCVVVLQQQWIHDNTSQFIKCLLSDSKNIRSVQNVTPTKISCEDPCDIKSNTWLQWNKQKPRIVRCSRQTVDNWMYHNNRKVHNFILVFSVFLDLLSHC